MNFDILCLGTEIHGMLFKPKNCVPGVKYPTMLYVYGGPGVQVIIIFTYVDFSSIKTLLFTIGVATS